MEEINHNTVPPLTVFLLVSAAILLLLINPLYAMVFGTILVFFFILKSYTIGLYILAGLSFTELASMAVLETYHVFLIVFLVTFLSYAISFSRDFKLQFRTNNIYIWLITFFTIVLFSGLYAENSVYWQKELYAFGRAFIIFFLITQGIVNEKSLYTTVRMIVFFLLFSSLYSFFSLHAEYHDVLSMLLFRFVGNLSDPNDFAMTICGALPFAVFFAKIENKWLLKASYIVCCIVLIFFVIVTQSRGGFVALAVSLLIMFRYFKRKIYIGLTAVGIFAILLTVVPPQLIFHRIITLFHILTGQILYDPSFSHRLAVIKSSISVFFEHPIIGVGANNFIMHSVRFLSASLYAHNMFAEIAVDLGLLGFVPFVFIIASPFFWFSKIIQKAEVNKNQKLADFIRFLRVSMIGMLITSFFLSCQTKPYLWVMLAIAYSTRSMVPASFEFKKDE